jgi:hypothetical protein
MMGMFRSAHTERHIMSSKLTQKSLAMNREMLDDEVIAF